MKNIKIYNNGNFQITYFKLIFIILNQNPTNNNQHAQKKLKYDR